ncbi:hypothetical protein I6F14_16050 [Bradyrhizobium sp. IC3069]|uniref:Uncharacterized protein n=1 Tax=Bradyrhizobium yuanmingense TaxID=108015 RepID=A0ABV4G9S3_9BRAD|nr:MULTISPECIES: hypothetical protein [Bradyrhizobium]MCA1381510.1 hypothetical protein [Bradyrhizobium sp. BRP05]MCA1359852.1 hypothetical protein [Bradyrhizobium sp. IC4059]MCA1393141.1 hypothetical protein [Bradyrhizobium sp. IC3123]MCA1412620.1 hypothetical protein [Bradyrhizobium sp. NBAIM20]MCA1417075.1 hypothetical protein [Bradyrhizobium sp. BRP23]
MAGLMEEFRVSGITAPMRDGRSHWQADIQFDAEVDGRQGELDPRNWNPLL